jgi:uncharacterized membrane protein
MANATGFETRRRSVVKSLSWRIFAAVITGCIAFAMTGKMDFAAKIGIIDTTVKLFIYFLHERVWNKVSFGRVAAPDYEV